VVELLCKKDAINIVMEVYMKKEHKNSCHGVIRSKSSTILNREPQVRRELRGFILLISIVMSMILAGCGGGDSGTTPIIPPPASDKITITFSTGSGSRVDPIEIDKNGSLPAEYFAGGSKAPTRDNYTFTVWRRGAATVTTATTFSDNATLTAQWTPVAGGSVTVSFSLGDGVAGTPPAPVTITNGTALGGQYPSPDPTRGGGWEFLGWYNGDTKYTSSTVITAAGTTFVLTAEWENDASEYAQNPAIHPGNHFVEIVPGGALTARVNEDFEANGLFCNIERGAGVLSSKWYRVTSEADANAATADVPTGTVIFEQHASAENPRELTLNFKWREPAAGTYWYYVIVTNTNVNATIQQTSSAITQNRLKVTVTE
jgi:uncharacterized repeat protein (TIGR02543 family)